MLQLNINGALYDIDVDPATPLLWVIRDYAGLTGTKYGCGMALCGACTMKQVLFLLQIIQKLHQVLRLLYKFRQECLLKEKFYPHQYLRLLFHHLP